jgi:type IV secretion system protein VirB10
MTVADNDGDRDPMQRDGQRADPGRYAQAGFPDLDAGIPLLGAIEHRRVNRKALVFLGAIIGLLGLAAAWMFHGAAAGPSTARKRGETIVIPQLPPARTISAPASVPLPIAVEPLQAGASPPLPPLPGPPSGPPPMPAPGATSPPPPTLMQRRMGGQDAAAGMQPANPYTQALLAGMPPPPGQIAAAEPVVAADGSGAQFIRHPDALLVRGTYVRCVLETRIVTDIPGFASCVVTEPTYSINGRNLLLPKGSKVSGRYDTDANGPRVAVVWDRITTPDGVDVGMASPGVDNLGGAGHPGDYDAHWGARISAALMISMISDAFKYEGAQHGPRTTTVGNGLMTQAPFDSNTARTMERLANQALDRSISRPATVTINQGTVLNIYVSKDVDFSAVTTAR